MVNFAMLEKDSVKFRHLLTDDNKDLRIRKNSFGYQGIFATPSDLDEFYHRFLGAFQKADKIGAVTMVQGVCNYYATWLGNFMYLLDEKTKFLETDEQKKLMKEVYKIFENSQPLNKKEKEKT